MRWPKLLNTAAAGVLIVLGIYHFSTVSPTNLSWRSGTIETVSAMLLLTAAYLLPRKTGAIINWVLAVGIAGVATYHATHAGLGSGITEWIMALGLAAAGAGMFRQRN